MKDQTNRAGLQFFCRRWVLALTAASCCGTAGADAGGSYGEGAASVQDSVGIAVKTAAASVQDSAEIAVKTEDVSDGSVVETTAATADYAWTESGQEVSEQPLSRTAGEDIEESYFSVMARLGLGLGLVVLLVWGIVYLLRKSPLGQQFGGGGLIRVAERIYLGPKKFICLVEIGDRTLALGVTEENINSLAEWPAGSLELAFGQQASASFASHFRKLLGQVKEEPTRQKDDPA